MENEIKPLSVTEQLQILESSLITISNHEYYGLCTCIRHNIEVITNISLHLIEIVKYIPDFNKKTVINICRNHDIFINETEIDYYGGYWWSIGDYDTRIEVLKLFIEYFKQKYNIL